MLKTIITFLAVSMCLYFFYDSLKTVESKKLKQVGKTIALVGFICALASVLIAIFVSLF